jgi:hypothetical protein
MVFAEKKSTLDKGRIESMNIIQQLLTQLPKNIVLKGAENTRPFECVGLSVHHLPILLIITELKVDRYSLYKFYFPSQENKFCVYLAGFLYDFQQTFVFRQ